jgi:hypothetical protein
MPPDTSPKSRHANAGEKPLEKTMEKLLRVTVRAFAAVRMLAVCDLKMPNVFYDPYLVT